MYLAETEAQTRMRAELRAYFEPADRALRELLGRELPWRAGSTTGLSHAG